MYFGIAFRMRLEMREQVMRPLHGIERGDSIKTRHFDTARTGS